MSWSAGTYRKGNYATNGWTGDASLGIGIEAGRHDSQDDDFATGINNCLTKDGQNTPTVNLPMGGFKHTGCGAASADTDYTTLGDVKAGISTQSGSLTINNTQFSNDTNAPRITFRKSRSATIGTNTIVQSGDTLGSIGFLGANGTGYDYAALIQVEVDGAPGASGDMPGRIRIFTTPDGSSTVQERMRIDNGGNMFFNTLTAFPTGSTAKINLDAGAAGIGLGVVQATALNTCISLQNSATAGTRYLMAFYNNTPTAVGSITHNGTNTAYGTSSDYRLKDNVAPMIGAVDVVKQLKPCTWDWKTTGAPGQGFIAHELQAVLPDAVIGNKDEVDENGNPIYQGVDTSYVVATLTAAIQELAARVETLEAA